METYKDKKFLDKNTCTELMELGYRERSDYWYAEYFGIRPSIIEEFPGLSDSGYYELTIPGGGNLNYEDVYGEQVYITNNSFNNQYERDNIEEGSFICPAITPIEAYRWVLDNYNIDIFIRRKSSNPAIFNLEMYFKIEGYDELVCMSNRGFTSVDSVIEYAIDYFIGFYKTNDSI